jgi:hypothetical protein
MDTVDTAARGAPPQNLMDTLIVLPVYFLALANPLLYMPMIMKSVQLGQLGSVGDTRHAAGELLGSTFFAGCLAVLFWLLLKLAPNLWTYSWLMLAFGLYLAARLYRVLPSRHPASFWQNTGVTLLILVGPAVEVRMALFVVISLYAVLAMQVLEAWRSRRAAGRTGSQPGGELSTC